MKSFNKFQIFWHFFSFLVVFYAPIQLVAPSAVRMADAIEAISCTINFAVSFLVMVI